MLKIFTRHIRANNTIHIPHEVMIELGLNQDDLVQVTVKLVTKGLNQEHAQNQNSDQMQILVQKES